jgi:CheY-like chemotaxis protein
LPLIASAVRERAIPPAESPARLADVRVLLIDDHADTLEVLGVMLRENGMSVRTANSADSAIERLTVGGADVIVCDVAMPGEDGLSLMARIRAAGAPTLPAIALSAYARPEDRQRALAAGFNIHLAKPVEPADLLQAIGSVIAPQATPLR